MKNREKVIKWWNSMSFEEQYHKTTGALGSCRFPNTLTGSEIEELYNDEQLAEE